MQHKTIIKLMTFFARILQQ